VKRKMQIAILIAVCGVAVQTGACGSNNGTTASTSSSPVAAAPPDRRTLRPISLPDLARVEPSVARQLRDGYASLTATLQKPGTTDGDLGTAYGEMGRLLLAAEYRDVAEPCFLNAQALAPTVARWPYYLAHLYRGTGDAEKAVRSFERALQLQPDDLATLVWLGGAYLDQGRPADAEPLFARALSLQPRSVPALFGLGRAALARQEYASAVDHLEQALSLDPKEIVIHYPLAMAYRGMGNVEKAEAHLRQRGSGEIVPPDPLMQQLAALLESAVAYEVRGAQALDEGRWADAATDFRKGIELAPGEPSLRHKLGTALAMTGDTRGAAQQFEEVTRRWPTFAKAQYSLGVILAASGRYHEAIERFTAAAKSDPTYAVAELQWAEALRVSGHADESLAHYERAMKLDPRVAQARLGYAMALAGLKRYQEARVQLTEGVRIYPGQPEFADAMARLPN
jgi:tetratricopeptide (TPR) repeat protein